MVKSNGARCVPSSSTVPSLILSAPLSWPGSSANPSLQHLTDKSFLVTAVSTKLGKQIGWTLQKVLQRICSLILPSWATCSSKKNLLRFSLRYQPSSCLYFKLMNTWLLFSAFAIMVRFHFVERLFTFRWVVWFLSVSLVGNLTIGLLTQQ